VTSARDVNLKKVISGEIGSEEDVRRARCFLNLDPVFPSRVQRIESEIGSGKFKCPRDTWTAVKSVTMPIENLFSILATRETEVEVSIENKVNAR